ncbi:alpha-ketoglutarate-dependent dioxygenase AlkB [Neisseriaceae bacterium PsAf]|nr:alpha-ketoglutarate-dependent dioxygenase AlkB [Neisseriaceae bacterium PsAf]
MNYNLFDMDDTQIHLNLLPYEGDVINYGIILKPSEADYDYRFLLKDIDWQQDTVKIFGRTIVIKRKIGWYGEKDFMYSYSGTSRHAHVWTPELLTLKKLIENRAGYLFNSCLLNLYHDGGEGMSWHSDDELILGKNPVIASLILGATRRFCFKHKRQHIKTELLLSHGQLIIMKGETQNNWLHCVPKMLKIQEPRINLTFRTILEL